MSFDKPCAIPLCPFMRKPGSYVCAAHDRGSKPKAAKSRSKRIELPFEEQCRLAGLPIPVREYTFHPTRKWRFDHVFLDAKLAVEVEGGVFLKEGSRHSRGAGFRKDCIKYAEGLILGWRVLRVLPEHIIDGTALTWCDRILRPSLDNQNASI